MTNKVPGTFKALKQHKVRKMPRKAKPCKLATTAASGKCTSAFKLQLLSVRAAIRLSSRQNSKYTVQQIYHITTDGHQANGSKQDLIHNS